VIHVLYSRRRNMATATQGAEDADNNAGIGEVSLGQKMLSAVSGSVLTSLLGKFTGTDFTDVLSVLDEDSFCCT
jgi:hypothetical protein